MSRDLFAGVAALLTERVVRPLLFIKAEFPSKTKRIWTGLGQIGFADQTWEGVGEIAGLDVFSESLDSAARGISCTFEATQEDDILSLILGDEYQGSVVTVFLSFWDTSQGSFLGKTSSGATAGSGPADSNLVFALDTNSDSGQDISGNGNHGTYDGRLTYRSNVQTLDWAPVGKALQYSEYALHYAPIPQATDFPATVSCWFRQVGYENQQREFIVGLGEFSGDDNYAAIFTRANFVGLAVKQSTSGSFEEVMGSSVNTNDDQWHFLMLTCRSGTDKELFVDGVSVASITTNQPAVDWDGIMIGAFHNSYNSNSDFWSNSVTLNSVKVHDVGFSDAEAGAYYSQMASQAANTLIPADGLDESALAMHIPMNGVSGADSSGRGFHLDVVGSPVSTAGAIASSGTGLYFDGAGQFLEKTGYYNNGCPIKTVPFTFSGWVKVDPGTVGYSHCFSICDNSNNDLSLCVYQTGELFFTRGSNSISQRATGVFISLGVWTHVLYTVKTGSTGTSGIGSETPGGGEVKLYKNGTLAWSQSQSEWVQDPTSLIGTGVYTIGTRLGNTGEDTYDQDAPSKLSLDDVKVHARCMTPAEVPKYYAAITATPAEDIYKGLILWQGNLDTDIVKINTEGSTIELFAEHKLVDQLRPRPARWTYADQERLNPGLGDTGLSRIERIQDTPIPWGRTT